MLTSRAINVLLLIAVLLVAGLAGAGFGSNPAPAAAGYAATIDLQRVLAAYKGLAGQQEEVELMARGSQERLDTLQSELDQLRGQMMVYAKGSKEHLDKTWEIERKKLEIEQMAQELRYALDKRKAEILQGALADIEEKVGKYAFEHGIDMVTATPFPVSKVKTANPQDILKWLGEVDIVWSNDALDITDAVITIVNGS